MNKITAYTNLEIGKPELVPASEEEVDEQIDALVKKSSTMIEKDGKAEMGDTVNIDFDGFLDGVRFDGGKGENYDLALGSGTFIPGFEEQLVGYGKDEDVDVNVTFPENYQAADLAGKAVVFKCKIHAVKNVIAAEKDDALAQKFGCSTYAELRTEIEKELNMKKEADRKNKYIDSVVNKVIETSEIEVTEEDIAAKMEQMLAYYTNMLSQYGMSLEQYLQMSNITMDDFKEQMKPQVIATCKGDAVVKYVAECEKLEVSDAEIEVELQVYKDQYHFNDEQMEEFKKNNSASVKEELLNRKIGTFLYNSNN